ncbi:MAG: hypothetical protein Kow0031_02770 [Anaerolineae bacterium]
MLKALAAGGATAAAALLPERWISPVVEVGVLPAHAQTSLAAFNLTCGAAGASVPQDGVITAIQVEVPPIYPGHAELVCTVTTSDSRYPASAFNTLTTQVTPVGVAAYPDFALPLETGSPAIAEGSVITFTIAFANPSAFGHDSCSTTVTVSAPTGKTNLAALGQPRWRK